MRTVSSSPGDQGPVYAAPVASVRTALPVVKSRHRDPNRISRSDSPSPVSSTTSIPDRCPTSLRVGAWNRM
ncbi:hypothetical protein GCM10025787_02580 [Saccharopolyspora rosea]